MTTLPFVRSKLGNCYLLVLIDGFTKFVNITPVKNTRSLTTIKVLQDHFSYFGVPTRLITDRRTSFTSKTFKDFVTENGIKQVLNAVATPRANGQVERFNRTITDALATSNLLSTVMNNTLNLTPLNELDTIREEASERIETQQLKDADRFNKRRKRSRKYKVGD